jgi:tetratricopeptide (TPR) repeat protein
MEEDMHEKFYWGDGGQYGPYSMQDDGWPNVGEVQRDYRERRGISAEAFAILYGERLKKLGRKTRRGKEGKVTGNWILNMEKQNTVPTDIVRRRIIAELLGIPPLLFGLASLAPEESNVRQQEQEQKRVPSVVLKRASVDLARFQREYRTIWQLHVMGNAHHCLQAIRATLQELETLEQECGGDLQRQVQEYFLGYLLLATRVYRDRYRYQTAYSYADKAVKVATSREIEPMLGPALFERGTTSKRWGLYGEIEETGALKPDLHKIALSIPDLEEVMRLAHPQLKGFAALELGEVKGITQRSETDITLALRVSDQAERWLGHDDADSLYLYMRQMVSGQSLLNRGRVLFGQAITFNAVGHPGKAEETIETLRNLKRGNGISTSHSRLNALVDIVRAEALMGIKEFDQAAFYALEALKVCLDVQSQPNIILIGDIYSRLLKSTFRNHSQVKELGILLRRGHPLWKDEGVQP